MALGTFIIRPPYTPHSFYLRGIIRLQTRHRFVAGCLACRDIGSTGTAKQRHTEPGDSPNGGVLGCRGLGFRAYRGVGFRTWGLGIEGFRGSESRIIPYKNVYLPSRAPPVSTRKVTSRLWVSRHRVWCKLLLSLAQHIIPKTLNPKPQIP